MNGLDIEAKNLI